MSKGMCLIQSNKTNKCTTNSFIYYYLVRVGSGLPRYANSLSTPVPVGIHGGVQGYAPSDQKLSRDCPPCVMACRGVSLGP